MSDPSRGRPRLSMGWRPATRGHKWTPGGWAGPTPWPPGSRGLAGESRSASTHLVVPLAEAPSRGQARDPVRCPGRQTARHLRGSHAPAGVPPPYRLVAGTSPHRDAYPGECHFHDYRRATREACCSATRLPCWACSCLSLSSPNRADQQAALSVVDLPAGTRRPHHREPALAFCRTGSRPCAGRADGRFVSDAGNLSWNLAR